MSEKGWRIWPSSLHWAELERSVRIHVLIALGLYVVVAAAGFFKPGPTRKDMMMFEFARAHVDEGLSQTHGYNLGAKWDTSPTKVFFGSHHVYVSAPPLYPMFCGTLYALAGKHWRALRLAPIILGLIYLYSCLALAGKFLSGPARAWLMYFALSPMILIYATDLEINTGHLGLAVLSYLCFTNYLETGRRNWMIWTGVFYLVAFWNSYIAFSIVPAITVQLFLQRRQGLWLWLGIVALGFAVMLIHLALLPGALNWAIERVETRSSAQLEGGHITAAAFVIRQGIRLVTHFTPVCVLLAGGALIVALRRFRQRQAIALLHFYTWGLPSGLLAVNLAYIHPHYLYYFAIFFAFGSALGLQWIAEQFPKSIGRNAMIGGAVSLFLVMTLGRSLLAIAGRSLPGLVYDYLPAAVTSRWNVDDRNQKGPVVIPPEQW